MLSCAVVGCGAAGMAAALSLRQAGLMVTVFEVAPKPGGIWVCDSTLTHTDRGLLAPIPPAMRCVIPKDLMSFSDLQMYSSIPQFPHHSAVGDYMRRFGEQRGVNAITRFNTKVESIRYDEHANVWKVISVGLINSDAYEWSFDRVVVATGQTHAPRYPPEAKLLKGFSDAGGTVTHSCFVKQPREFSRKKVVVVGDGVSAYDLCQQLLQVGSEVIHSTRLSPEEDPTPSLLSFGALASPGASEHIKRSANVSGIATLLRRRGSGHHTNEVIKGLMRNRHTSGQSHKRVGKIVELQGDRDLLVRDDPTKKRSTSQILSELDKMGDRIDVSLIPSEELLTDVDAVLFATGYHTRYPFLPKEMRGVLEEEPAQELLTDSAGSSSPPHPTRGLYRGCLWEANPTIGFVGNLPDAFPPIMVMEAQSRFLGRTFAGKRPLPTSFAEDESLVADRYPALKTYFPDRGLGLASTQYYNSLCDEPASGTPALQPPNSFADALLRRKWWFISTWIMQGINRVRGLAPLKRRKQHVLFSNKV